MTLACVAAFSAAMRTVIRISLGSVDAATALASTWLGLGVGVGVGVRVRGYGQG